MSLRALHSLVGENGILFFEGGNPDKELEDYIKKHLIHPKVQIARGTICVRKRDAL